MIGSRAPLNDSFSTTCDWEGYQSVLKIPGRSPRPSDLRRRNLGAHDAAPHSHERTNPSFGRMIEAPTEELDFDRVFVRINDLGLRRARSRIWNPMNVSTSRVLASSATRGTLTSKIDPPPDLAVEIDITSSSERRLSIYSSLKIPEVWLFDGENLTVLRLQDDGSYRTSERSEELPFLPMADIAAFIRDYQPGTDTQWAKTFRRWVRETIVPRARDGDDGN